MSLLFILIPRLLSWGRGCNPSSISLLCFVYTHHFIMSTDFFVFHTSGGISTRLAVLLRLTFSVQRQVLLLWCLLGYQQFFDRFISGSYVWVSNRFLKCSFHFWSLSSRLVGFSFALAVLFLPLTLFYVCHANHDCLSSTEFLILLI